jgi:hypothetical protein
MATVWRVLGANQGSELLAVLPWPDCRALLEVGEHSRTEDRPKSGDAEPLAPPAYVVVQVEAREARQHGIVPGFFVSPLPPHEAAARVEG